MPKKILVATPDSAFGEWLRVSLAESGDYEARLAGNAGEALSLAAALPAALAILDAELPGGSLSALVDALHAVPARVLILLPDNDPYHPAAALPADAVVQRPFDITDLLNTIRAMKPARPTAITWLDDPARGEQDLNALLPDTGAQAALIIYEGSLWTWSGALDRDDADETIERVNWQIAAHSGLARYLRLNANGWEYLLYAVALAEGLVLALLFPPDQPLTLAHAQTVSVARGLPRRVASTPPPPPQSEHVEASSSAPDEEDLQPLDEEFGEEIEFDLSALLAGMPPPDPGGAPLFPADDWKITPEAADQPVIASVEPEIPPPAAPPLAVSAPAAAEPQIPAWLEIEPSPSPPQPAPSTALDDTSPVKVSGQVGKTGPLRPAAVSLSTVPRPFAPTPAIADDVFTCLLLPRDPEVSLSGDLAKHLALWLEQFCLSFGWRLEQLVIRPEYLMWSLRLPVGMSSSQAVYIFRKRTSERVFQHFPRLIPAQPGQDFWSPGYLSLPGMQPPTLNVLREFIISARRSQGYQVY